MRSDLVHFGSDLHLEFEKGTRHTVSVGEGNLLILAGDIFLPGHYDSDQQHQLVVDSFLSDVSDRYTDVLVVAGNHEHYGSDIMFTEEKIRDIFSGYRNIELLSDASVVRQGIEIFGATLWTDMKNHDPIAISAIRNGLNDYQEIRSSRYRNIRPYKINKVLPEEILAQNTVSRSLLINFLNEDVTLKNRLVVTHHAISEQSIMPSFKHDLTSYAYSNTGLDDLYFDVGDWTHIHGHMHKNTFDKFGNVDTHCHARGYPNQATYSGYQFKSFRMEQR